MRFFSILLVFFNITATAGNIVSVVDFGLQPNSRVNATPYIQKAIDFCHKQPGTTLIFPKGRYDFWAQYAIEKEYFETNTTDNNPKTLAVMLDQINNLTIDGNGAELIMHGKMQPFTLDRCNGVSLRNFTVDWEIPLTAQGEVTQVTNQYIEVKIDRMQYPYIIENNQLTFVGEGWKSALWAIMQFDPQTKLVLPNTGDNLGWRRYEAVEVEPGLVRLWDSKEDLSRKFPPAGTLLVLRHSSRDHAGIFIFHSNDTHLENITLHHTGGLGILSQYSKNITFDNVHIIPNVAKGRVLSGHDDGFHFMGCSGLLKIEQCSWVGLMDDPINIHGTCSRIMEVLSPTRLKCKFMQDMSEGMIWGRPGEEVGFIENKTMHTVARRTMKGFDAISPSEFILELTSPLPSGIAAGHVIENLTCTPDAEIRNCFFGSCRARGLLVSTPGKVVIEDNIFESSGSAILIAGDANAWYESGAVKDILIHRNEFRYPCNSSLYQFCEAVISIAPEIPTPDAQYPYHRNIRITDNTFQLFDYPVLFARSVDGLVFSDNRLIRNNTYQPYHYRKDGITLEACKNVLISDNRIEGDVLGRNIKFKGMKASDIKLKKEAFFQLRK